MVGSGARDLGFQSKIRERFRMKVCAKVVMPKITLEITGWHNILGWDYRIEKPYWGTLVLYRSTIHFSNLFLSKAVFQNPVQSPLLFIPSLQSVVLSPQSIFYTKCRLKNILFAVPITQARLAHMSYFECFNLTISTIYCFYPKSRLFFVGNWVLLTRTPAYS